MSSPGEYSGIREAVKSVHSEEDYRGPGNILEDAPSPEDVIHGTDALTGFEAGTTVSGEEKARLNEIDALYRRSEAALEDCAAELGVSSLNEFSPRAVLFMVAFRDLQNEHAGKANLNPHKLSVLRGGRYTVK